MIVFYLPEHCEATDLTEKTVNIMVLLS